MAVVAGGLPAEVEDANRSCRDWITVEPSTFRLLPEEGLRLICRMQPPKNVSGGYYAIISCNGTPSRGSDERTAESGVGAAIEFSHRALIPVLLTIPAPQLKAVIDAGNAIITCSKEKGGYTVEIPVRNRGNIHTRMSGTIEVRSEAGQLIDKFELEAGRGFILPEHERPFIGKLSANLPDGVYVAQARLEAELSGPPMRNSFPFYIKDGQPTVAEITDDLRAKLGTQSVGFAVMPAQMLVMLRAGARRSQVVEVINLTKDTIPIRASLMEWYRVVNGQDMVSDEEPPHGHSGKAFVEIPQQELELGPLSRRRVPLIVSLPKEATGERYIAVTFDRSDIQLDASPANRTRRSVLVRAYAQGTGTTEAEITQFEATRKPNGAIDLSVQFRNKGDVSIIPEVTFKIEDENGNPKGKIKPTWASPFVQAGCEGVISSEWSKVLDAGNYTAELSFQAARDKLPITKRTKFVVPKVSESGSKTTTAMEENKTEITTTTNKNSTK
jgi:hypothetical protein